MKYFGSNAVQLSSSMLLGQIFSVVSSSLFSDFFPAPEKLVQWMCWQLKGTNLTAEIAEQVHLIQFIFIFTVYSLR